MTPYHFRSGQLLGKKEPRRATLACMDVPQFVQLFFLGLSQGVVERVLTSRIGKKCLSWWSVTPILNLLARIFNTGWRLY